eukprot:11163917-Prorocentrum_lima.AAC.1
MERRAKGTCSKIATIGREAQKAWVIGGQDPHGSMSNMSSQSTTPGLEAIFDGTLKQALMADQSELFAFWDIGASHFLLPLDRFPKAATDTRKAT